MEHSPENHEAETYSKTVFGFWVYLLSDLVLFATIFAAYVVLRDSTCGKVTASELLPLSYTLMQTLVLLTCSFTSGLGAIMAHRGNKKGVIYCFGLTFLLGAIFMWMEFLGFSFLVQAGNGWDASAFLSAYFTLLGTHALHVIFALLWILVILPPIWRQGLSIVALQRVTCLKMFWQFLSVVWIAIFTIVYLMGVS